ncbi:MAG: outer membrane lipoprotein-sorting protein [Candidatus Rokuibacteriota bacterium]
MRPERSLSACIAIAAVLAVRATAAAADDEGRQLIQKVIAAIPKVTLEASATLDSEGGIVRLLDLKRKLTKEGDASYLEVSAPQNLKNTRFLFIERGPEGSLQYIYTPSFGRTVRVGGDARKQSFLGSEFYVSDLIMPDLNAFTFSITGDEEVGGRKCKLVESVPRNPADEPYSKVVMAIDPVDALIVRTQFYDPKGKLLKVWTVEKIEKVQGYWTPRLHSIANVQDNTRSKLEITEVRYDVDIPNEVFTKPYLER